MDFLKAPLARIPEQLKGLTLSQRMLAGTLVTVMILTMVLWAHYASTADMEPVVDDTISVDDAGSMADALQQHGIESKLIGDKLYVNAEQKQEALTWLMWQRRMPSDSVDGFDKMFKEMSPFDTGSRDEVMLNEAKSITLSKLIGGFPHVRFAKVVIDAQQERQIGGSIDPVAYVAIQTDGSPDARDGEADLVKSAGYALIGSQRGLTIENVKVTIDGTLRVAHDPKDGIGDDVYNEIAKQEERVQQKLATALSYMQKPLIAVSVDKNLQSGREVRQQYSAVQSKEKTIETKTDESSQTAPPAQEPGAVPNTGLSLTGASSGGNTTSTDSSKSEFENWPSYTHTETNQPVSLALPSSVSVDIPRSYLVMLYKNQQASAGNGNPDDAALAPVLKDEVEKTRSIVLKSTGLKSPTDVYVTSYDDEIQPPVSTDLAPAAARVTSPGMGALLGAHGRELGIGALAAFSLAVVTMMARKGGTMGPVPATTGGQAFMEITKEEAQVAGSSEHALEAVELDDEAMQAQQVVEQVSTMVKQDPDAAAAMIKRWLNRA